MAYRPSLVLLTIHIKLLCHTGQVGFYYLCISTYYVIEDEFGFITYTYQIVMSYRSRFAFAYIFADRQVKQISL